MMYYLFTYYIVQYDYDYAMSKLLTFYELFTF